MKTAMTKTMLTAAMVLGVCGLSACTGTTGTNTTSNTGPNTGSGSAGFIQRGSYQASNATQNSQRFSASGQNTPESGEQAFGGEYAQNTFDQDQNNPDSAPTGRGSSRVFVSIPGASRAPEGFATGTDNWAQATFTTEGSDFDPCISRDGKTLVFASTQHRPTSDIYAKSVDGRVVTQLTNDASDDVMPNISPDASGSPLPATATATGTSS